MPAANVLLQSNISNNDSTKYQFSVLTAVRHWYDGDPTGQNENYGIMLRYYDESLTGYYNSVYSGDVVDTNSRPKLTISYTLADGSVAVWRMIFWGIQKIYIKINVTFWGSEHIYRVEGRWTRWLTKTIDATPVWQ